MTAMKPGSGGPYSEQKSLRAAISCLKNDLANKPMGRRTRRKMKSYLVELKEDLSAINAKIRQMKSRADNQ